MRDVYTPTLKHKYAVGNWFNPIKRHAFPLIGELPINDIEPRHIAAILAALDAADLSKSGPRLRAHIAVIFNAAIANGDRDPLRGKRTHYRGMSANHLVRQVTGFRAFDKDSYRREDDLYDAAMYAALVSLGDGTEKRWDRLRRVA